MKRIVSLLIVLLSIPSTLLAASVTDRIEMGVSPIKHEFTVTPGTTIEKVITFYNNSDTPYNIYLTAEDCTADSSFGTPKCEKSPNVKGDPIYVSTWIEFLDTGTFTVPPQSERKITFRIKTPSNAIPGGHYGAIFFNSPTVNPGSNAVSMVRRIGTLMLVTVPGQIVYNTVFGSISIGPGGGGGGGGGGGRGSSATISPTLGVSNLPQSPSEWVDYVTDILDPRFAAPELPPITDFGVDFQIPVTNSGNVHVMPVGRIELLDDNGVTLKKIGKESVRTPEGVFVGEKVVDYLPINDEAGNVLPNSARTYSITWKGFAYETIENGKAVIKFSSPQDYYNSEIRDLGPLMPWEKFRIVPLDRQLKAKIYIEYAGSGSTPVPYETEEFINVKYQSVIKSLNYGMIAIIVLVLLIIWIIMIFRKDEKRLTHLEEEVGFLEEEVDELERGREMAKSAIAKKKSTVKKATITGTKKKEPGVLDSVKTDPKPEAKSEKKVTTKKPVTPRVKKTQE